MFFKWLSKKIAQANMGEEVVMKSRTLAQYDDSDDGDNPIRFELTTAVGGRILRVRRYDRKTHENEVQTYVIPQGEDVGERVTKIVNLELIK